MNHGFLSALTLLTCFAANCQAQDFTDTIRLRDGRTETGKVQSEDASGVVLLKGKATANISWQDISEVKYGGAQEFDAGMRLIQAGNFADAVPQLQKAAEDKKLRPLLRPQVLWHLASSQQRLGNFDDAVATYTELIKTGAKTKYLPRAVQGIVDARSSQQKDAMQAFTAAVASAKEAGTESSELSSLDLLKGRILERQKKFSEAKAVYSTGVITNSGHPNLVKAAELGVARCTQAEGKGPAALLLYRAIVDAAAPQEVWSGAWNGIADITSEDAKASKNADRMLEALYAYLRGVVEFLPAPGESTAEYEHALAGTAKCFTYLAEIVTDPDKKKTYAERAKARTLQLKKEFPSSEYLPKK